MATFPGDYAVPGAMWPGSIWPADPIPAASPAGAAVIFTLGTPLFQGMSQLSTLYYLVPANATREGAAYDPTSDPVAFAFMPQATQVPQSGDWVAAAWDTVSSDILYPYRLKCLVGPSGTVTLGVGRYIAYVRITDSPEIPVLIAGYLSIS